MSSDHLGKNCLQKLEDVEIKQLVSLTDKADEVVISFISAANAAATAAAEHAATAARVAAESADAVKAAALRAAADNAAAAAKAAAERAAAEQAAAVRAAAAQAAAATRVAAEKAAVKGKLGAGLSVPAFAAGLARPQAAKGKKKQKMEQVPAACGPPAEVSLQEAIIAGCGPLSVVLARLPLEGVAVHKMISLVYAADGRGLGMFNAEEKAECLKFLGKGTSVLSQAVRRAFGVPEL